MPYFKSRMPCVKPASQPDISYKPNCLGGSLTSSCEGRTGTWKMCVCMCRERERDGGKRIMACFKVGSQDGLSIFSPLLTPVSNPKANLHPCSRPPHWGQQGHRSEWNAPMHSGIGLPPAFFVSVFDFSVLALLAPPRIKTKTTKRSNFCFISFLGRIVSMMLSSFIVYCKIFLFRPYPTNAKNTS